VLLDAESKYLTETLSDNQGRFEIQPPSPGDYRLSASGMGYAPKVTELLVVESGREITVNLLLAVNPVALDSLKVVTEARTRQLELVGFYNRLGKGFGHFIQKEEIDRSHADRVTDLLYGLPGVRIVRSGTAGELAVLLRGCLASIVFDGMVLDSGSVNEVIHPYNIEAIEVYPGIGGVPVQYRTPKNACGAILIWTRR